MKTCVFPGSFDPVTIGHLDLIRRASKLFDRVTVAVMINVAKKGIFAPDERVCLLQKACKDIENVQVLQWDGLLTDYLRIHHETCVIRGVRNGAEFENESINAQANAMLYPGTETLLMFAGNGMNCVSSSAVREIAAFGGDIHPFIPENVREEIDHKLKGENHHG